MKCRRDCKLTIAINEAPFLLQLYGCQAFAKLQPVIETRRYDRRATSVDVADLRLTPICSYGHINYEKRIGIRLHDGERNIVRFREVRNSNQRRGPFFYSLLTTHCPLLTLTVICGYRN